MKSLFLLLILSNICLSSPQLNVSSPNARIGIEFRLEREGAPEWKVTGPGGVILQWSPLGLTFLKGKPLTFHFTLVNSAIVERNETYELVVGKTRKARDHFRELQIQLKESVEPFRRLDIAFRAYDDGVAFRYVLPQQESLSEFDITKENTEFHFPADMKCWAFQINTFISSYEGNYLPTTVDALPDTGLTYLPLTMQRADGVTLAIAEAELVDYAGMYLRGLPGASLRVALAPLPDKSGTCVRGKTPFASPWRVLMIGERPGDLIESTIILNLNAPCALDNVSWIKPGKAIFPWWPNFYCDKPGVASKLDFENQKYYIDFASDNNLEYLELEPPWYGDEDGAINRPHLYDITKPVPEIQLPALFEYAKKKNVGMFLWTHWENVNRQAGTAFPLFAKWGAAGVKIDFMNRDDQEMVRWYHTILKKAAEHHLMVFFHGAYKPTGTQRTYPHLLTQEGVLGKEQNKVTYLCSMEHTMTLPFTRMLAGPMDFTPGGFRNVTREQFKPDMNQPMVLGTRCHQLAMFVAYESPLQMVCDDPAAYRNQPGLDFIRYVPSSWDETKVIEGKIGEVIIIARRKGADWYIGGMTDWTARDVSIPLDFLGEGEYEAEIYQDVADSRPTELTIVKTTVTSQSTIAVRMAQGGGVVARVRR
jgi:alpha-glucosidase